MANYLNHLKSKCISESHISFLVQLEFGLEENSVTLIAVFIVSQAKILSGSTNVDQLWNQ